MALKMQRSAFCTLVQPQECVTCLRTRFSLGLRSHGEMKPEKSSKARNSEVEKRWSEWLAHINPFVFCICMGLADHTDAVTWMLHAGSFSCQNRRNTLSPSITCEFCSGPTCGLEHSKAGHSSKTQWCAYFYSCLINHSFEDTLSRPFLFQTSSHSPRPRFSKANILFNTQPFGHS